MEEFDAREELARLRVFVMQLAERIAICSEILGRLAERKREEQIMRLGINLPEEIEKGIKAYREMRKAETGKVMQNTTAIIELLRKALGGIEPPKPIEDRLAAIEERLTAIEGKQS